MTPEEVETFFEACYLVVGPYTGFDIQGEDKDRERAIAYIKFRYEFFGGKVESKSHHTTGWRVAATSVPNGHPCVLRNYELFCLKKRDAQRRLW